MIEDSGWCHTLKGTAGYVLEGRIFDDAKALHLCLDTDADHAPGVDVKSTSGMMLTLEGPNSFLAFMLGFQTSGSDCT